VLLCTVALAAFAPLGCGDDSDSDDSGGGAASGSSASDSGSKAQYTEPAKKYMAPIESWPGPTSGPKAQPDKKVTMITCSFAVEGCKLPADTVPALREALGWSINAVDGQGNPKVYNQAIQSAINQNADGIVLIGISSAVVAAQLKAARQAGIVVASWDSANEPASDGVTINVDAPGELQGQVLASYLISETEGETKALVVDDPEFNAVVAWVKGATETFEDCATCTIEESFDIAAADIATNVPKQFVATLRQHPDINVIVAPYNAAIIPTVPAMAAAGVGDQAKMGTFSAIKAGFTFLEQKKLAALVAEPHQWGTWATFDQMNRVFADQPQVEQNVPIRLFTDTEPADELPSGGEWDGDIDYQSYFTRIWSGE
jgi:ribose transport system substrate-binding protein